MTGRELVLVLGGATVLGGSAGIAAALLAPAAPAPAPVAPRTDDGVLERLENLERDLGAVRAERDELRAALEASRREVAEARETAATAGLERPIIFEGDPDASPFASNQGREAVARLEEALKRMGADGNVRVQFGGTDPRSGLAWSTGEQPDEETMSRLRDHMAGLRKGMSLRLLPEEKRWEQARDELGLSASQEENLRLALADRDRDLEAAFVTEKDETDGAGGRLQVRRVDPALAQQANDNFRSRVDSTLSTDQREKWNSGGYDHAFGATPFGGHSGATVMAVTTHTTTTVDGESSSESSSSGGDE